MSDDDQLARSLRALRDSTDGTSEHAGSTRADILARLRMRQKRRRRFATIALPLAAAFLIGTAWAAATGRLSLLHTGPATTATAPRASAAGGMPVAPAPSAAPAPSSVASEETPDAGTLAQATPAAAPSVSAARNHMQNTHDARHLVSAREQALYDTAHQAHFTAHDPEAALRGWNAYLAAFPDGEYALEARYNRAISLVRTGRRTEAAAALTPFARGAYGGYRQSEARDLLDALGSDASP